MSDAGVRRLREALHFYDPVRGEYLADLSGNLTKRGRKLTRRGKKQSADAMRRRKRAGKPKQERLREEQAARQALEAELRELRRRGR